MRIYQVSSIRLTLMKSQPPQLLVEVDGFTATPGWKELELVPLEKKLSADGILDLEFVGKPPSGIVAQVLRPVSADIVITDEVEKIVGVMVHARDNKLTTFFGGGPEAAAMGGGRFTTLALGEETSPVGEKFPIGEKSAFIGEEKLPHGEKSPVVGEEKFPSGEKTIFFGEEGRGTLPNGETLLGGETGLGGESGPLTLETDPGIETAKPAFGEDTVVGEDFDNVFRDRIRSPFNRR